MRAIVAPTVGQRQGRSAGRADSTRRHLRALPVTQPSSAGRYDAACLRAVGHLDAAAVVLPSRTLATTRPAAQTEALASSRRIAGRRQTAGAQGRLTGGT